MDHKNIYYQLTDSVRFVVGVRPGCHFSENLAPSGSAQVLLSLSVPSCKCITALEMNGCDHILKGGGPLPGSKRKKGRSGWGHIQGNSHAGEYTNKKKFIMNN